jgi:hypothetical protein
MSEENRAVTWASEAITVITCGPPKDHECDSDGPTIYGGDGVPTLTDQSKAGKGYSWGSVTCSKCGKSSMENSLWRDETESAKEAENTYKEVTEMESAK